MTVNRAGSGMVTSQKSLAFACGVLAAVVAVLTAHLHEYRGTLKVAHLLLLFCGLEIAMLVLLVRTLRSGSGKVQFSLFTTVAAVLVMGALMALNLGALPQRGVISRAVGWPLTVGRTETVFQNGVQRQVLWDVNKGYITLDIAIAVCIVTACLILCESFVRLKQRQKEG